MERQAIERVLELHCKWLTDTAGGVRADLRGADLRGADLRRTYLQGGDLRWAYLPHFQICPEVGSFMGWKKLGDGAICQLLIPEDAKRTSSLVGRKCRAEYVEVLEGEGITTHNGIETPYIVGEITRPNSYDDDIRIECTHGIHFFITQKEAKEY